MRYDILLLIFLVIGVLYYAHRRKRTAVRAEQQKMFDECLSLFEKHNITQGDIDYPVLRGRYNGHDATLKPIADNLAFRTIPSLWLLVTLHEKVPFQGIFDFLVRPRNVEFYSPSERLKVDIAIPEGWPLPAVLRTDKPEEMPPQKVLESHMEFFDDYRAKEMLITPDGVRLVYQAKQAERSYYMLLRQIVFEDINIPRALVKNLLDAAVAIYEDLIRENAQIGRKTEK